MGNEMNIVRTLFSAAAIAFACVGPASAQKIACDTMYKVKSGDSLSRIAGRAYGRTTAYQIIFDYNPGVLKSPSDLPQNVELYIPCVGSSGEPVLDPIADAKSDDLKILTGSDYPPYVDAGLPNGGFSHELVERALQYNGGKADYRIDTINDWGSHLKPLIADGAYDLGFPWFKPDCSNKDKLGAASTWRCNHLRFSEPLHEVVVSFYTRKEDDGRIEAPRDAEGMRLCRPRGYFIHDLEAMDLIPPAVIRVAADNPTDCFERLMEGDVDIVSVNADTADSTITELGVRSKVAEAINLATIQTLHVVGLKANPKTRINLLRINKGLIGMRKDDTFRKLAEKHLGTD